MKPEDYQNEAAAGGPGAEGAAGADQATATPEPGQQDEVPAPADAQARPAETAEPGEPAAEVEPDALETARAEAERWKDKCLRTAADFDNFRKRSRRETEEAIRRAREAVIRDLLPVFDNLERAVDHAESATDVQALVDGIRLVMRLFGDTLAKLGVTRVKSVGEPFDPALHEALQQLETGDYPPGAVAAEVLAGYRMGERLIRPAAVVVARPPSAPSPDPEPTA